MEIKKLFTCNEYCTYLIKSPQHTNPKDCPLSAPLRAHCYTRAYNVCKCADNDISVVLLLLVVVLVVAVVVAPFVVAGCRLCARIMREKSQRISLGIGDCLGAACPKRRVPHVACHTAQYSTEQQLASLSCPGGN